MDASPPKVDRSPRRENYMPRIRTIKPEFWSDEKLSPMDPIDRLVFLGLISMADDYGRLLDNLKIIDAFVFPNCSRTSRESLQNLSRASRIRRGKSVNGQSIIEIVNWSRHQRVDKPQYQLALPPISENPKEITHSESIPEQFANNSGTSRELFLPVPGSGSGSGPRSGSNISSEPNGNRSLQASELSGFVFPVIGSEDYQLPKAKLEEWQQTFVGVNVDLELSRAAQWLRDNPTRRKTLRGIQRFLGAWLTRVQDSGRVRTTVDAPIDEAKRLAGKNRARIEVLRKRARVIVVDEMRKKGEPLEDFLIDERTQKLAEILFAKENQQNAG